MTAKTAKEKVLKRMSRWSEEQALLALEAAYEIAPGEQSYEERLAAVKQAAESQGRRKR